MIAPNMHATTMPTVSAFDRAPKWASETVSGLDVDDGRVPVKDNEVAGESRENEEDAVAADLAGVAVVSGRTALSVVCEVDDNEDAKHSQSNDRKERASLLL